MVNAVTSRHHRLVKHKEMYQAMLQRIHYCPGSFHQSFFLGPPTVIGSAEVQTDDTQLFKHTADQRTH